LESQNPRALSERGGQALVMTAEYDRGKAFYETHYETVVEATLIGTRKIYIWKATPQHCRFCRLQAPAVMFRNDAHTFPELIGNRFLLSCDECDTCNKLFSETIEDNYAKFTTLQRVASQVKGKGGTPTFRSNDKRTRWEVKAGQGQIQAENDGKTVQVDLENKKMRFTAIRPPYYPILAFKCLVKMGLAVMPPSELAHFARALDWLQVATPAPVALPFPCWVLLSTVSGNAPFKVITFRLLRRKSGTAAWPHYTFILMWGNYVEQIFLPFSAADSHLASAMTVPFHPNPGAQPGSPRKVTYHALDLSSCDRKVDGTHSIDFVMDSIVKIDGGGPSST
jgi:hypothetical protein